jgi:hypothetical protein
LQDFLETIPIPKWGTLYQTAVCKIFKIYQHFPFNRAVKYTQIGILGMKYTIWQPWTECKEIELGQILQTNFTVVMPRQNFCNERIFYSL